MKKIIGAIAVIGVLGSSVFGATVRDNCGCGLGGLLLGDQEATFLAQIGATFLNGISGNQTFGITSGTLGCEPFSAIASTEKAIQFVEGNMDQLALDMAFGEGESLDALADLMEIPLASRVEVYADIQHNFENIFSSEDVTAAEVVNQIRQLAHS